MQHTFPTATFVVGEGPARRIGTVRDVVLTVEKARVLDRQTSDSPFLMGPIRAEGSFLEECRPNSSLLAVGREAVLKLAAKDRWSLAGVLIMKLGEIRTPAPKQRLYQWSFLVTGRPRDPLRLFPEHGPGEMALEDLLEINQDSV